MKLQYVMQYQFDKSLGLHNARKIYNYVFEYHNNNIIIFVVLSSAWAAQYTDTIQNCTVNTFFKVFIKH